MTKVEYRKTVLSMPNTVGILVYLLKVGGKTRASYLRSVVKNYDSIVKTGRILEDIGLLKIVVRKDRIIFHSYELTEEGRKVAKRLKEVEDYINTLNQGQQD